MWQVLKAVTISFTICPGLKRKKYFSPFYLKKKNCYLVTFARRISFSKKVLFAMGCLQ